MNIKFKKALVAGTVAFSLMAGIPVLAQDDQGGDQEGGRPPMMRGGYDRLPPPGPVGLRDRIVNFFNKEDDRGDRPMEKRIEGRGEEEKMIPGMKNFGGVVSSVNGSSFTIGSRGPGMGLGREGATTTISVATDALTVFKKNGREQGTISDVVLGNMVMIIGQFSTSTKTISAKRVDIMTLPMKGERGERERMMGTSTRPYGDDRKDMMATGTPMARPSQSRIDEARQALKDLFSRFSDVFGRGR